MAVQVKETLAKLMDPKSPRQLGIWKINIPTNKMALLNALNLWFILIRVFDKLKTLMKMIPFKPLSLLKKSRSKKKSKKGSLANSKKPKVVPKEATTEDKKGGFSQPRKPSEKFLDSLSFNWKFFSENFYYPSIFIQNADFVSSTLQPTLLHPQLCSDLIDFARKYLAEKPKDKFQRKLTKHFMRLMLTFERVQERDLKIISYLADLVQINKTTVKKGMDNSQTSSTFWMSTPSKTCCC